MVEANLVVHRRNRFRRPGLGRVTWGWRLVHSNGNVIATDGNQGYANRAEALRVGTRVVTGGYSVDVNPSDAVADTLGL